MRLLKVAKPSNLCHSLVHTHIHTYISIYIYTHTHTYIHTIRNINAYRIQQDRHNVNIQMDTCSVIVKVYAFCV